MNVHMGDPVLLTIGRVFLLLVSGVSTSGSSSITKYLTRTLECPLFVMEEMYYNKMAIISKECLIAYVRCVCPPLLSSVGLYAIWLPWAQC